MVAFHGHGHSPLDSVFGAVGSPEVCKGLGLIAWGCADGLFWEEWMSKGGENVVD